MNQPPTTFRDAGATVSGDRAPAVLGREGGNVALHDDAAKLADGHAFTADPIDARRCRCGVLLADHG